MIYVDLSCYSCKWQREHISCMSHRNMIMDLACTIFDRVKKVKAMQRMKMWNLRPDHLSNTAIQVHTGILDPYSDKSDNEEAIWLSTCVSIQKSLITNTSAGMAHLSWYNGTGICARSCDWSTVYASKWPKLEGRGINASLVSWFQHHVSLLLSWD